MSFAKFFSVSNSSIHHLQGNVLDCVIEQRLDNKAIINTGLRSSFVCLQEEIIPSGPSSVLKVQTPPNKTNFTRPLENTKAPFTTKKNRHKPGFFARGDAEYTKFGWNRFNALKNHSASPLGYDQPNRFWSEKKACGTLEVSEFSLREKTENSQALSSCIVGIGEKRSLFNGEYICSPSKSMEKESKRKLVWTELTKFWHSKTKNRVNGFILNPVNGGFAVAISGYIAFLPKSLCVTKKVFLGQWRQFSIISMNSKIANIVVQEIQPNSVFKTEKEKNRNTQKFRRMR